MPYSYRGAQIDWKVKSVLYASEKGSENRFVAANAIQRSGIEQTVKDQLSTLKAQIGAQLSGGAGSESYEL